LRTDVADAERILEELLDCKLIIEPVRGRFRYHALLHEYARWLSLREDSDTERRHTMQRILDAYLWIADQADRLRYPHRRRITVPITHPPPSPPIGSIAPEAQNWLTTEHDNLISAPYFADRHGSSVYIAHFAHVLAGYLESGGHWEEAARLHERAVAVWRNDGDKAGLTHALSDLSTVQWRTGNYDRALEIAEEALGICHTSNDQIGYADLLDHIGQINWHRSDYVAALTHFQEAYEIRCDVDDRRGQADALAHTAVAFFPIGKYAEAREKFNQGLAIYRELGDWERQMMTLNNLGDVELRLGHDDLAQEYYERAGRAAEMNRQHKAIWQNNLANIFQRRGRYPTALEYYRIALETYRQIGDRQGEADVLINIGSTLQRMGRHGEALIHHQMALSIATDISERSEQTRAFRHIGQIHHQSGRFAAAYENHQQALDLAIRIKDPYERAQALNGIGYALLHIEGQEPALYRWRTALRLFEQLGVPEAETLREKLQSWDDATEGMT
jgi:tetratricopeptide (TPR) repeat protein